MELFEFILPETEVLIACESRVPLQGLIVDIMYITFSVSSILSSSTIDVKSNPPKGTFVTGMGAPAEMGDGWAASVVHTGELGDVGGMWCPYR